MIGKSFMTVVNWRSHFLENGKIPESYSGKYDPQGLIWSNEHLNSKATK